MTYLNSIWVLIEMGKGRYVTEEQPGPSRQVYLLKIFSRHLESTLFFSSFPFWFFFFFPFFSQDETGRQPQLGSSDDTHNSFSVIEDHLLNHR